MHFSSQPHLAGSPQDFQDAKDILQLFQTEFDISPPKEEPIYSAGTPKSRANTIKLTIPFSGSKPTAWIDVYYPYMDTPLDHSLEIVGDDGHSIWSADLSEDGDPLDEDAAKYKDYIPAWHGYSGHGEAEGNVSLLFLDWYMLIVATAHLRRLWNESCMYQDPPSSNAF